MQYDFKQESERMRFYKSNVWRGVNGVRNQVVMRDNYECQWCKREGYATVDGMTKLEVDHIIELEDCTYEMAIDLDNLRTLCNKHHNLRHDRFKNKFKSSNRWAHDERW